MNMDPLNEHYRTGAAKVAKVAIVPPQAHQGIESAIERFKAALPGWWYTLGECERSCDASCAPTRESQDLALIPFDERFNSGFHCDLPQPSTLADALGAVAHLALLARLVARRQREEAKP